MIKISLRTLFITMFMIFASAGIFAQNGTPPPPPDDPSSGGNGPVGGGAPIGSGMAFFLALGLGYGAKKVYDARKTGKGPSML